MRTVEEQIRSALEDESATVLSIGSWYNGCRPPLTVIDSQCIIECLQQTPRVDTLEIFHYSLHDDAVLNVFRDGLPLCTSITTVKLDRTQLTNEDLDRLRPAFYNTSVTKLVIIENYSIQGQRGGEVLRDLLVGNNTLRELILQTNPIGPEGAIGFGQGLAGNHGLQVLDLNGCRIGNEGLANLLPADGMINNSLLHLDLRYNDIEGAEGGRQVSLLLGCFPTLKVLDLAANCSLGPLGAHELAPGLAAARHLEVLGLSDCRLGNNGVASLIPDGQVNRSLTHLDLGRYNNIQGLEGGENVIALASRCTNLNRLDVSDNYIISPEQRSRLDMLLDPKQRLCTEASALGGSTFPVLFRFVEKAHCHKHGLSAIFVILQNDGDDYFCFALNRAID